MFISSASFPGCTLHFVACSLELQQAAEAGHGQEKPGKEASITLSVKHARVHLVNSFLQLYIEIKALHFIMSTTNRTSGRGVVVMSIDNLPAQLPREATDYFGSLLLPFIKDSVSLPMEHTPTYISCPILV